MPDGPVSILPNSATALENNDLLYVSKDLIGSYESQKMNHQDLRATLGLVGTEGYLSKYISGDVFGDESGFFQDTNGYIALNKNTGLDSNFSVYYPGGSPAPTYLFDFNSVAGNGMKMTRLGGNFFAGIAIDDAQYDDENLRFNFNKYLYRFGNIGVGTETYEKVNWETGAGSDLNLQAIFGSTNQGSVMFNKTDKVASLIFNKSTSLNNLVLDIEGTDVFTAYCEGGVGFTDLTTTERDAIASPQEGTTIYNTTTGQHEWFDGTTWKALGGGDNIYTANGALTGPRILETNGNRLTYENGIVSIQTWDDDGYVGIGAFPVDDNVLTVSGYTTDNTENAFRVQDGAGNRIFIIRNDGISTFYEQGSGLSLRTWDGDVLLNGDPADNGKTLIGAPDPAFGVDGQLEVSMAKFTSGIIVENNSSRTSDTNIYSRILNANRAVGFGVFANTSSTDPVAYSNWGGANYFNAPVAGANTTNHRTGFGQSLYGSLDNSRVYIKGETSDNTTSAIKVVNLAGAVAMQILNNSHVLLPNLPTSATGLIAGTLWNDAGTIKIA